MANDLLFGNFNAKMGGVVELNDGTTTYSAQNFMLLLRDVKNYRIDNGGDLSVGWQDRVGVAVCEQNWDSRCTEHTKAGRKFSVSDLAVFFESMNKWRKEGFKTVDQDEAEKRASVCASCPHNVKVEGCRGCFKLLQRVQSLIGNAKTTNDHLLQGCEICACSLQAKVWLPKSAGQVDRYKAKWPDHCWLKED